MDTHIFKSLVDGEGVHNPLFTQIVDNCDVAYGLTKDLAPKEVYCTFVVYLCTFLTGETHRLCLIS